MSSDSADVCRQFGDLCSELHAFVPQLADSVIEFLANDTERRDDQAIPAMQLQNQLLHAEIRAEEQSMRQVALDIFESEESTLIVAVRAIWILSQNCHNALEIINSTTAMHSILDLLASQTRREIADGCLGVFGNLCHTPQSRGLFMSVYGQPYIQILITLAKRRIDEAIDPLSKTLELSVILFHNLSLDDDAAVTIVDCGLLESLVTVAVSFAENMDLFDVAIATLNTLLRPGDAGRLALLGEEAAARLMQATADVEVTTGIVQLRTTIRTGYPGL